MPVRTADDRVRLHAARPAPTITDETDLHRSGQLSMDRSSPILTPQAIPRLQQALGNRAVARLLAPTAPVQRTRHGPKGQQGSKKKNAKTIAKVLNGKAYASWNDFYKDCATYLRTGGKERLVWLNRAEAMNLTPPSTATGAHGSQPQGGGFDAHVLGAVDIYVDVTVKAAWNRRSEDHDLIKDEAAQIARRRAGL